MTDQPAEHWFNHEKLDVYRESIRFVAWASQLLEKTHRSGAVKDHLERASESVVLNLAEGNGKFLPKDRCRFFDIAHGSALECAGALDVIVARGRASAADIRPGKHMLQNIVRMLMGLIKLNSSREYEKVPVPTGGPPSS